LYTSTTTEEALTSPGSESARKTSLPGGTDAVAKGVWSLSAAKRTRLAKVKRKRKVPAAQQGVFKPV
jgi:hypothetical protein